MGNNPLKTKARQYQSQTLAHKRFCFQTGKTEPAQERSQDMIDIDHNNNNNSTNGNIHMCLESVDFAEL